MQWSKNKKRWRTLLADSVRNRVDLHVTQYRHLHDREGDAWLTFNGVECLRFTNMWAVGHRKHKRGLDFWPSKQSEDLPKDWQYSQHDFWIAFVTWLDAPIETSLVHDLPLVRALAMLDRRVGKRRLRSLPTDQEHLAVRVLLEVRRECEGILCPTRPAL
ncbi:MAG: hypothetical protein AAGF84_02355 [Planctomycetota bacterium]